MDVLPLIEYVPLFPTKAEAKRYRKQVLEHVASMELERVEFESERQRILQSFPKREPFTAGEDFIAIWHYYNDGGTAVRRNRKRELKRKR